MFTAYYVSRRCLRCGKTDDHMVCGNAGNKIITCMNCQYSEDEADMKRSYKLIEHNEVAESVRKKKGIATIERTTEGSLYFVGDKEPTVDIIKVSYPIWDNDHFTNQVQLAGGGHLDHTAAKAISEEINKFVKPKKED